MTNFITAIKAIGYICSIILPALDAMKGICHGVRDAVSEKRWEDETVDIKEYIRVETEEN